MPSTLQLDLLCESCGYSILSLPDNGACPECGRGRKLSLPGTRSGTPWQIAPSVLSWCVTAAQIAHSPKRFFENLQIHEKSGRVLLVTNLSIASLFLAHPLVGVLRFDPSRGLDPSSIRGMLATALSAFVFWTAALVLFSTLTIIEYLGIRFFAARRQWRLLPAAALQICAHSSYAWIAASLLTIVGLSLSSFLPQFGSNRTPITFWDEIVRAVRFMLPGIPPLVGFAIGMIWFEWLVFVGVRSCKFANAATLPTERNNG